MCCFNETWIWRLLGSGGYGLRPNRPYRVLFQFGVRDEVEQFVELVNQVIGAGACFVLQGADVGVALGDGDGRAACRFAREDVVGGIAHHQHFLRLYAEGGSGAGKR